MSTLPKKLAKRPNERDFKFIIIHSSGTVEDEPYTAKDIDDWHKRRGWVGIGYNFVIDLDGTVELGRSLTLQGPTARRRVATMTASAYVTSVASTASTKSATPAHHSRSWHWKPSCRR